MNIARIFHVYFAFIMALSAFALASYHGDVWRYFQNSYVSVIDVMDLRGIGHGDVGEEVVGKKTLDRRGEELLAAFRGELIREENGGFYYLGEDAFEGFSIMVEGKGRLEGLRIEMSGDDVVKEAELLIGEKVVKGKVESDALLFNNLKIELADVTEIKLKLSMKESVMSGNRLGFRLAQGSFKVAGGMNYYFFPLEDEQKLYFSIVGKK
ncbi:hypothetical protein KA119_01855 [Candidatus Gracilibacteria bacterium]|nr:hypothetical protein [Candidatus Gracilibacteria bacterium]